MRFQLSLVVVVWFLLGLVVLDRWGEAAEGRAPIWLTAPDTIPPESVLWQGVAMPLAEVQRRVAEAWWAQQLEAELRRVAEAWWGRQLSGGAAITEERLRREGLEEAKRRASAPGPPLNPQVFPVVSIGRPESWPLPDLYPPQHMPPLMQAQLQAADFYLIRLSCSFRPVPRSRVGWARFHVSLRPDSLGRQPVAYDILPVNVTQEVKHQLKFTLAPTLKFRTVVEVEVGSLEFGLEYTELQPMIVGAGIGEDTPTWDYQTATGMAGIQGVRVMHLLVKAPKGMPAATAQLALTAQVYVERGPSWIPMVWGPAEQGARLDVPLWPAPRIP
jgi:hypothetical protein